MSEFESKGNPMRNIRVTGTAAVSEKPDLVVITFRVSSLEYQFKTCMEKLAISTEQLREDLASVGLERDSIKTTRFDVDVKYEYDRKREQSFFKGYEAIHNLKVEFPFTQKYLNEVLNVLSNTESQTTFRISFQISDPEPLRQQALTDAVKNSREKAEVLARAAGVNLGEVVHIDYSWGEIRIRPEREVCELECLCESAAEHDVTPEDIDVSDTVTITWSIM